MREKLRRHTLTPALFRGIFCRFGIRMNGSACVLLHSVIDHAGQPLADHLWFKDAAPFAKLGLHAGDQVEFTARAEVYIRKSGTLDYCFGSPTNIRKTE